jgi:hypothetical protein
VTHYVVGGEYTDTTFTELATAPLVLGPFDSYEEAYLVWRGRALETIDQAYVRFHIVEADEPPAPPVGARSTQSR